MAASPMIGRSSSPSCVKCGSPMPVGAAFCSNCGTQIGEDIAQRLARSIRLYGGHAGVRFPDTLNHGVGIGNWHATVALQAYHPLIKRAAIRFAHHVAALKLKTIVLEAAYLSTTSKMNSQNRVPAVLVWMLQLKPSGSWSAPLYHRPKGTMPV